MKSEIVKFAFTAALGLALAFTFSCSDLPPLDETPASSSSNPEISGGIIKNIGVVASYVYGRSRVGCLLGEAVYGNISNSYSKCIVKAKSSNAGGLVGTSRAVTISDCYSTSKVSGPNSIGGLVGNLSALVNDYGNGTGSKLSKSYSTGKVSGTGTSPSAIGGLVGNLSSSRTDNSTVINGYYDQQTSTQTDTDKGEGKPTAEMQTTDFATTLGNAFKYKAGSYPQLTWEK